MKLLNSSLIILTMALIILTGCFREDIRALTVNVPGMKSAECSKIIQTSLSRVDGIVSAEADIAQHQMIVTYDARKLAIMNIEYLITAAGFDANDSKGNPQAKAALPAECR